MHDPPSLGTAAVSARGFTPCQVRLLEFASHVPRARVAGVAGSGMTTLALEQARRSVAAGRDTLLLCAGRRHAGWLRAALVARDTGVAGAARAPEARLRVDCFLDLCRSVAEAAGARYVVPEDPDARAEFGEWGAPELLLEHLDEAGACWDAIVVDGGQDFFADWWDALQPCLARRATFHVFYDEAQDVYGARGIGALEALPRFELRGSCRAPSAPATALEVVADAGRRRAAIEAVATRWFGDRGVAPAAAVILAPYRRSGTCLAEVAHLAGVPLTECVDAWRAGRGLLVTTIRGFRGLEADAVAMIDLPALHSCPAFGRADLHVGRSRARRWLHLFPKEADRALAA